MSETALEYFVVEFDDIVHETRHSDPIAVFDIIKNGTLGMQFIEIHNYTVEPNFCRVIEGYQLEQRPKYTLAYSRVPQTGAMLGYLYSNIFSKEPEKLYVVSVKENPNVAI